MCHKVKGSFANNKRITDKYPIIGESVDKTNNLIGQIEATDKEGASSTLGTYRSKIELKESMAMEASELASAAFAYAKAKKDTELQAVLEISYSDIRYVDDQEAYTTASALHSELSALDPAEIEKYLISAKDLRNFNSQVELFHSIRENTNHQFSVARNRKLTGLFKQITDHLKDDLDNLMNRIKRKEPEFYDIYTNARVIHDLGKSPKKKRDDEDQEA